MTILQTKRVSVPRSKIATRPINVPTSAKNAGTHQMRNERAAPQPSSEGVNVHQSTAFNPRNNNVALPCSQHVPSNKWQSSFCVRLVNTTFAAKSLPTAILTQHRGEHNRKNRCIRMKHRKLDAKSQNCNRFSSVLKQVSPYSSVVVFLGASQ